MAGRVMAAETDRRPQIDLAFQLTLGRRPSGEELSDIESFFAEYETDEDDENASAMVDFCLALLNASEFVYLE